jgi:hypothetical protein
MAQIPLLPLPIHHDATFSPFDTHFQFAHNRLVRTELQKWRLLQRSSVGGSMALCTNVPYKERVSSCLCKSQTPEQTCLIH